MPDELVRIAESSVPTYEIRECQSPTCRLRFPVTTAELGLTNCPRCSGSLIVAAHGTLVREKLVANPQSRPIHVSALLDNIRSVFNAGSMFRTADGAGLGHLYLCGITATPQHRKLAKTALGADSRVKWTYHPNALDTARELIGAGNVLWAIEDQQGACSLYECDVPDEPLIVIVGNEVVGVDPGLLNLCEQQVAIPMFGVKRSLNVATAFGVAVYWLTHRQAALSVQDRSFSPTA